MVNFKDILALSPYQRSNVMDHCSSATLPVHPLQTSHYLVAIVFKHLWLSDFLLDTVPTHSEALSQICNWNLFQVYFCPSLVSIDNPMSVWKDDHSMHYQCGWYC